MSMTSLERMLATLAFSEPDRVAYFLPVTMHGALELGVPLGEYYSKGEYVAEGQLRLRAKYRDDVLYPFFYGAVEYEAFGGEVDHFDDGPANAVGTLLSTAADVRALEAPRVAEAACLHKILRCLEILKEKAGGEALIVGVVMSPFSLPVMQMGFARYLELIAEEPAAAATLVAKNAAFTIEWANAQLEAGAHAIGYFDPVASPTILPTPVFEELGLPAMRQVMREVKGPCAALTASGLALPILEDVATTAAVILGVSPDEDVARAKTEAAGRLTILGNLNGIQMRRWTPQEAWQTATDLIDAAAAGGGFILSETHGEVPVQVPEDVLLAVSAAVAESGGRRRADSERTVP